MASLKDIAAAANVSIATVSKALHDQSDVGEKTKERIRQIAQDLGYMPNAAARALKTSRTHSLGVLFSDEAQSGLTHDYYNTLLDSFKRQAERQGYDITFINCDRTRPNRMSYLAHTRYRGFDGVCIACVDFYDPEVTELVRSTIPVVTIDHIFDSCTAVLSDNVAGIHDLIRFIAERGYTRIAYIHGYDSAVTRARLSSFYKTMTECGFEIVPDYIREAAYRDSRGCHDEVLRLLDLPVPPEVILCPDDYASIGAFNAIRERGLRIPEDISIAGYDGIAIARHVSPALTTIAQDTSAMGKAAAVELIEQIENPMTTLTRTITIQGKLLPGGTVGTKS